MDDEMCKRIQDAGLEIAWNVMQITANPGEGFLALSLAFATVYETQRVAGNLVPADGTAPTIEKLIDLLTKTIPLDVEVVQRMLATGEIKYEGTTRATETLQ